VLYICSLQWK